MNEGLSISSYHRYKGDVVGQRGTFFFKIPLQGQLRSKRVDQSVNRLSKARTDTPFGLTNRSLCFSGGQMIRFWGSNHILTPMKSDVIRGSIIICRVDMIRFRGSNHILIPMKVAIVLGCDTSACKKFTLGGHKFPSMVYYGETFS